MLVSLLLLAGSVPAAPHVVSVAEPLLEPEDGLLLGNGSLSVSVYQTRDRIVFRFGRGDVWDRRFDPSDDPKPPHISEIAHGIAVEGWKCPPYGGAEPVALHGTDNPERMRELCRGAPPSYNRRPYPCPKPVGELALQLPPDLPGLRIRHELSIEEGMLRTAVSSALGVEVTIDSFIHPELDVLVVRWGVTGWTDETRIGNGKPPVWLSLYRWADPALREFGDRFFAESRHGTFINSDDGQATPLAPPGIVDLGRHLAIEQTFAPELTYPAGFVYLMVPFCPGFQMEPATQPATREALIHLMPAQDVTSGWVAVAVPSGNGREAAAAQLAPYAALNTESGPAILDQWAQETREAGEAFWARSGLEVADPLVEGIWYETLHARRCTTRAGKTPPGLFLPSTVRDYSHWHGDYHTNYNFQQPYWGDYTANHVEIGDAYFTGMKYLVDVGRILADRYYGCRGTFIQLTGYPMVMDDDPLGAVPMGRMAYMTGWAANQYWWRYLYTLDLDWLREVGYPVIRDCALFYLDFMTQGEDGLYHIFPSNQGEDGFTGDPRDYTDRGQVMRHMRYCLRSAIAASEALDTDAELRAQWLDRLARAAGDDGNPPVERQGIERHFAEACAPELGEGRPWPGVLRADPATPWPGAMQWVDLWYAGQYPLIAMAQLRASAVEPERAYKGFRRIVERWRHPNGLVWAMSLMDYGHAGAWTETLGITAPLQEMLLQSYGGVIRIFPVWPRHVAARFRTFRAEGAFLISASCAGGAVTSVRIESERGGVCRLYSPWETPFRVVTVGSGENVAVEGPEDGIYQFETEAGGAYALEAL
ncbi:MAG TPA: hypothetical protein PLD23_19290 [Armatimonadota bacterium]|nr:hypothetical protein [Armatimonadota bacterium]